jgi:hypothetical protein
MWLRIEYFIAPNGWISGLRGLYSFFFNTKLCVECKWVDFSTVEKWRKEQLLKIFLDLSATLPDTEFERWKKFQGECNGSVSLHCSLDWKTRAISDSEGWNRLFQTCNQQKSMGYTGHSRESEFPKQKYFTFNGTTCYSSQRLLLHEVCEHCILFPKLHHFPTTWPGNHVNQTCSCALFTMP